MRDNLKKNQKRWATLLLALFFCMYYLITPLTANVVPEAIVYGNTTVATGSALGVSGNYKITNEYSNYLFVNGSSEQEVIVKEGEEVTITVLPTELFTEGGYHKESVEVLCNYKVLQEDGSEVLVASDGTFLMPEENLLIQVTTITLYQVHIIASPVAETSVQLVRNGYMLLDNLQTEWSSALGAGSVDLYAAEGDAII